MDGGSVSNPRDLSISLRAISSPNHVLNGGPKGSTFPGWFLQVQQNEGYDTILLKQLTLDEVIKITDACDPSDRTTNAAIACDKAMRNELMRQLTAAEAQAAKIPELKRRLGLDV